MQYLLPLVVFSLLAEEQSRQVSYSRWYQVTNSWPWSRGKGVARAKAEFVSEQMQCAKSASVHLILLLCALVLQAPSSSSAILCAKFECTIRMRYVLCAYGRLLGAFGLCNRTDLVCAAQSLVRFSRLLAPQQTAHWRPLARGRRLARLGEFAR